MKYPLQLNETEIRVFKHLLDLNEQHGLGLTFRVAGGWVRDRLLGIESHDIDIALDKMTGQQFCNAIGYNAAIVAAKPDQSKHLETAMAEFFGQQVEFVNLRDESWAGAYDETRILQENRFGTPEVDAERRDLTINALFFNLNTGEIEDYVNGLDHLGFDSKTGVRVIDEIRLFTPLPPEQTFLDDPLRVLRIVRFLSKLPGSFIAVNVLRCMYSPDIHDAFSKKISTERIAVELLGKREKDGFKKGILHGKDFAKSLDTLFYTGLLDIILDVPQMAGFKPFAMDQNSSHHKYDVYTHTIEVMKSISQHEEFKAMPLDRQSLFMLAALLHDLGKRDPACCQRREDGYSSYKGHEDSSAVVARAICNKLRLSDDDKRYVCDVVSAHMLPHSSGWGSAKTLRRFKHNFPNCWEDVILHAQCDCLGSGTERSDEEISRYKLFVLKGRELTLLDAKAPSTHKPIISGDVVMKLIPELPARCGFIKDVNAELLEIRLDKPETSEAEYLDHIACRLAPRLLEKYKQHVIAG